jgi:hypothetical protein
MTACGRGHGLTGRVKIGPLRGRPASLIARGGVAATARRFAAQVVLLALHGGEGANAPVGVPLLGTKKNSPDS